LNSFFARFLGLKHSAVALSLILLLTGVLGVQQNSEASVVKCSKLGQIAGGKICVKGSGGLQWATRVVSDNKPRTKAQNSSKGKSSSVSPTTNKNPTADSSRQQISVPNKRLYLNVGAVPLGDLPGVPDIAGYVATDSTICEIHTGKLFLHQPGLCVLTSSASESKTSYSFDVYTKDEIGVTLRQTYLPQMTIALPKTTMAGSVLKYKTLTPQTCNTFDQSIQTLEIGKCDFVASADTRPFIDPVDDKTFHFVIQKRNLVDNPDEKQGFLIKPIYVVPSDGTDNALDTDGYIANALQSGTQFLDSQIGKHFPIDTYNGTYDIQFFRTKYSKKELESALDPLDLVAQDYLASSQGKQANKDKDSLFFLDTGPILKNLNFPDGACALGQLPGNFAFVTVGSDYGYTQAEGWPSCNDSERHTALPTIWIHEILHTLGVHHVQEPCDVMNALGGWHCLPQFRELDPAHLHYIATGNQGSDVSQMNVWEMAMDSNVNLATCNINVDPLHDAAGWSYFDCPLGTHPISTIQTCWNGAHDFQLQSKFISGVDFPNSSTDSSAWANYSGDIYTTGSGWGSGVGIFCPSPGSVQPWVMINGTEKGIQEFQWIVDGVKSESFRIIWH
jgi:hypothetical protein